jgi:hypothetical protein
MAPDRRALFEAAYGALMIRNALPGPARRPAPQEGAEQNHNRLSAHKLANSIEPAPRVRP